MRPQKLKKGDHIRVIAPSRNMEVLSDDVVQLAEKRLGELGLTWSYGRHVRRMEMMNAASVSARVEDLHEAFGDPDVDGILTVIGGFNSNQILKSIDFDLIRQQPKVLCGFSDITALQNAILAEAGLITYSGPHFSTLGMEKGLDYTRKYFVKAVMENGSFDIQPAAHWSDDPWYADQKNRVFHENPGYCVIREGLAEGRIVGGNLSTFSLLHGTDFMPDLRGAVVFIEMTGPDGPETFDRLLQSLVMQPGFPEVKGLMIGRFQQATEMTDALLKRIVENKPELNDVPIVSGIDFGHTTPIITYPIGGKIWVHAQSGHVRITIE